MTLQELIARGFTPQQAQAILASYVPPTLTRDGSIIQPAVVTVNGSTGGGQGGNGTATSDFIEAEAEVAFVNGQVGYIKNNGRAALARADQFPACLAMGMAAADTAATFTAKLLTAAKYLDDWTAITGTVLLNAGATYYLDIVPGKIRATPLTTAGQWSLILGVAISTKTLELRIGEPILL